MINNTSIPKKIPSGVTIALYCILFFVLGLLSASFLGKKYTIEDLKTESTLAYERGLKDGAGKIPWVTSNTTIKTQWITREQRDLLTNHKAWYEIYSSEPPLHTREYLVFSNKEKKYNED